MAVDAVLGVDDTGMAWRIVVVPLPMLAIAGFFHEPSKNMLTARSTLFDEADWMIFNDSAGRVSPIMLKKRSASKPFEDEDCVGGGAVASLAAGWIVPLCIGDVVKVSPAASCLGVSVDNNPLMGLVSPQAAAPPLEGVSGRLMGPSCSSRLGKWRGKDASPIPAVESGEERELSTKKRCLFAGRCSRSSFIIVVDTFELSCKEGKEDLGRRAEKRETGAIDVSVP
jgi:hypothetical protein